MYQWSIDRGKKILWLLLLLPIMVNFSCGKKNLPVESVETQEIETKKAREIFLEKIKRQEKSDLRKNETKEVYPKWKEEVKIDKERGREELNEKIKEVMQELKEITQDDNLSEEEKNKMRKELKKDLREYMIEGPCEISGEEKKSIWEQFDSIR